MVPAITTPVICMCYGNFVSILPNFMHSLSSDKIYPTAYSVSQRKSIPFEYVEVKTYVTF
jgi:hypothetical protein